MNKQVCEYVIASRAINTKRPRSSGKYKMAANNTNMDFNEAIQYGLSKVNYESLKEVQRKTVEAYLCGKDVFVCAPTGSGKSLCFEVAPYAIDWVKFGPVEGETTVRTVCVVVAPLVSLMNDQVASLQRKGIAAICIGPDCAPEDIEAIKNGKYNLVFGSPEALLNSYRHVFRGGEMRNLLGAVFIDESHCIAKWGKSQGSEEAFRADYGRLGELRSLMRKEVPFITLTATATASTKAVIIKDLCMKGCVEVLDSPNRPNTHYAVVEVNIDDLYSSFCWLIEELEKSNVSTPKVIIFCRRKQHMKELYELFSQCLGANAYYRPTGNEPSDDRSRLFAMYHKKTHKLVKETVEKEPRKANGAARVPICSIAFGMGVNIKEAYLDLHLGPSGDLDDYLQETGRIGRDSTQISHAVLLKYKACTASKNITKDMKNYVKNTTFCRRKMLLNHFDANEVSETVLHACCDVCARMCKCLCLCKNDCECATKCSQQDCSSLMEKHLSNLNSSICSVTKEKIHNISKQNAAKVRAALLDYRAELATVSDTKECPGNLLTGLDIATGFSTSLIEGIVTNLPYIKDKEYLEEDFAFFSEEHVHKTWEIVNFALLASLESDSEDDDASSIYDPRAHTCSSSDSDSGSNLSRSSDSDVCYTVRRQFHGIVSSEESSSSDS